MSSPTVPPGIPADAALLPPVPAPPSSKPQRVASLDQFRGYTVFGMAFVNFLGSYTFLPEVFKHRHTFFSYADAIMPQFLFAVGYAFRLTLLRTREREGFAAALRKGLWRCLGLMLVAFVVHGVSGGVQSYKELVDKHDFGSFLHAAFKRGYFQTLSHIAVTSLWVLPVIMLSARARLTWALLSALIHICISFVFKHVGWWQWSAYDWALSDPVAIDGGPLGFLTWTMPLIAGSFAYDWCAHPSEEKPKAPLRLFGWVSLAILVVGFVAYDARNGWGWVKSVTEVTDSFQAARAASAEVAKIADAKEAKAAWMAQAFPAWQEFWKTAETLGWAALKGLAFAVAAGLLVVCALADFGKRPAWVPAHATRLLSWGAILMLAAYLLCCLNLRFPPNQDSDRWFIEPAFYATKGEMKNYWTMSQRAGSVTYLLFAAGFSLAVMAFFVVVSDGLKWRSRFLETLGSNALLAYILLGLLEDALHPWFPKDSPAWFALTGWAIQMAIVWAILRNLQKNNVYIKV